MNLSEHWNQVYQTKASDDVSWYQTKSAISLKLIEATGIGKDKGIIDVGGGASVLVDFLLDAGFTKLAVLDIAATALQHARLRLGAKAGDVEWFEADVTTFNPVEYDPRYLEIIPPEVIEKDYGCGDPSRHLKSGETVLDLGSGTGKICFIAAQVVGPKGRVIGVDMIDEMLEIARRNAPIVAERLGYANVEFRKGRIQDLGLDLEILDAELKKHPIANVNTFLRAQELAADLHLKQPLIETESVDVVVSNCVLNLVEPQDKRQLFQEIFRVLKKGGRAVISDIVSDEDVPEVMQQDPTLWSGCISGALREDLFLKAFEDAGFYGIYLLKREEKPWQTVQGIEFRSVTVEAFKGKQGECRELNQAVIYRGPFCEVLDDDGHRLRRGERVAVCDKTFDLYRKAPYAENFLFIEPCEPVKPEEAKPFACGPTRPRHPREMKGTECTATTAASQCCDGGSC